MMDDIDGEFSFLLREGVDTKGEDDILLTDSSVAERLKIQKVGVFLKVTEFPYAKELIKSADCYLIVAHVNPSSWVNVEEYVEFEAKCNGALQDLEKNPLVLDIRAMFATLKGQVEKLHGEYSRLVLEEKNREIDGLKHDRAAIVVKVVPHVALELTRSDEMGFYVGNDLATASYPFLAKATADPYAPLEVLLSKKPKSLHASSSNVKSAPSHPQSKSKPSSSKTINQDS
ncbi:hypothetical protein Tco_1004445 [Tanacetum coccineum]|uniref:Uncharacterized protein n=1 Tax=Tanacetum coccineum TaxID=301880 RepID=A0ABQ5FDU6_9ASTR